MMNGLKRTFIFLAAIALLFAALPLAASAAGNFNWTVGQAANDKLESPYPQGTMHSYGLTDALPDGMSITPGTGTATEFWISGTPTTVGSGSFTVEFDAAGFPSERVTYYWTVREPRGAGNPRQDDSDEPVCYIIDSRAGAGGNIAPEGKVEVEEQGRKSYLIYPDDGYVIDRVLVDGQNIGPVERYVFESVIANHTIEAYFRSENPEPAPSPLPENITYNPSTGAPVGSGKGWVSLGVSLLLLGGAWLHKEKH